MPAPKISIALGAGEATVLVPGLEEALAFPVSLPFVGDDATPALSLLFAQIQEALSGSEALKDDGSTRLRVRVALLPPLCDARMIPLPPLRPDEMQAVLRRDAARHFLGSARPMIVAGERLGEGRSDAAVPVFAAAAPRALVDGLQRAAEARGWELERIVPAHAAWLHALDDVEGGAAEESAAIAVRLLVAVEGETAHLIRVVGGAPERIRRVPAGDPAAVLEAAGPEPGTALLLADREASAPLESALVGAGWVLARPGGRSARATAARHAGDASPELVPAHLAWARKERSRRTSVRMVAAAVVTVAAAAVVHLLGTAAQYRAAQRERAELRDAVAPALAARDSLDWISERVQELQAMGHESARWTFALVEISVLLPTDTHLISLRAAGDTAVIEAEGGHAGDALEALRTATALHDVRIEGNIQREIEDGSAAGERFTLSAVLAPRDRAAKDGESAPAAVTGGAP